MSANSEGICDNLKAVVDGIRLVARLSGFLVGRVRGDGDQDVGNPQLAFTRSLLLLVAEIILDLRRRDLDAVVDFALAQPRDGDLVADIFPEFLEGVAIGAEDFPELRHRQVVFLGDVGDGCIEALVVDHNAGAVSDLQLDFFEDQTFNYLAFEHRRRRHRGPLLAQLLAYPVELLVDLALHDDVFVDDCDDAVEFHRR